MSDMFPGGPLFWGPAIFWLVVIAGAIGGAGFLLGRCL